MYTKSIIVGLPYSSLRDISIYWRWGIVDSLYAILTTLINFNLILIISLRVGIEGKCESIHTIIIACLFSHGFINSFGTWYQWIKPPSVSTVWVPSYRLSLKLNLNLGCNNRYTKKTIVSPPFWYFILVI